MTHILFATEDTENTEKIRSVMSAQAGIKLWMFGVRVRNSSEFLL